MPKDGAGYLAGNDKIEIITASNSKNSTNLPAKQIVGNNSLVFADSEKPNATPGIGAGNEGDNEMKELINAPNIENSNNLQAHDIGGNNSVGFGKFRKSGYFRNKNNRGEIFEANSIFS